MKKITKRRSFVKALSWRIIGSTIAGLFVWFVSEEKNLGLYFGAADFVLKIILYYIHERIWVKIKFGIKEE